MKSTDMFELAKAAADLLAKLEAPATPVLNERLTSQRDETRAVFVANVKASALQAAEALRELYRRADAAGHLFEANENFEEGLRAMQKRQEAHDAPSAVAHRATVE